MTRDTVVLISDKAALKRQDSLVEGAKKLGFRIERFQGSVPGSARFAICSRMRFPTYSARKACEAAGIPVMVVELGYLKRANNNQELDGYFQLGWNKIGWVPNEAPSDRFEILGLELRPIKTPGPEDYYLLAGQVGMDAQHNLNSNALISWLVSTAKKNNVQGRPVVYRPHPNQPFTRLFSNFKHTRQDPRLVKLEDALEQARAVITYNSTTGVEAMLRGVPVISHPSAHYHHAAKSTDEGERSAYLHRLAYAQWTLEELASGAAISFLLENTPEGTK